MRALYIFSRKESQNDDAVSSEIESSPGFGVNLWGDTFSGVFIFSLTLMSFIIPRSISKKYQYSKDGLLLDTMGRALS